jgi:serine/threonine protein kinase
MRHCPQDGLRLVTVEEHERNPHDPYLGRTLGGNRYVLLGLLGEGAMGAVYLARQLPLEREVAVKVIRPLATSNPRARDLLMQRFTREAQLQADFNHHAVVTLLDFGIEPDGTMYMVMERLHGRVLADVLTETSPRVLVGMVTQLLDALTRFHDQGLIHRDIKPDNVMVLDGPPLFEDVPRIKLIDFGIAKSMKDQSNVKLTQDGTVFGTPEYMAPEQAIGIPDAVDHRSDLYAVGALLYEGLSGNAPFVATTPLAVLHKVVNTPPAPLPESVPPALAAVVLKALAKGKADRPQSAAEFAARLGEAMGSTQRGPSAAPVLNRANTTEPQPKKRTTGTSAATPTANQPETQRGARGTGGPNLDPRDAFAVQAPLDDDFDAMKPKTLGGGRRAVVVVAVVVAAAAAWALLGSRGARTVSQDPVRVTVGSPTPPTSPPNSSTAPRP